MRKLISFKFVGLLAALGLVLGLSSSTQAGVMVPFALAGSACGHYVSGRMSQEMFRGAVLLLLLATGLYMLYSTLGAG